jgi:hypothetical protein
MSCLWCGASWDHRTSWAGVQLWACDAHRQDYDALLLALKRLPYQNDGRWATRWTRDFLAEQERGLPSEPCWKEFT